MNCFKGVEISMLHKTAKLALNIMDENDDAKTIALGRALSSPTDCTYCAFYRKNP